MNTRQTIIRHLKGIVATLEKEEQEDKKFTYRGKKLEECSDEELLKMWRLSFNGTSGVDFGNRLAFDNAITPIMQKRGLSLEMSK
jgi:hypothetical protein